MKLLKAAAPLDYRAPFVALLASFERERRNGTARQEHETVRLHMEPHRSAWNEVLPGFPEDHDRAAVARRRMSKKRRDLYLRRALVGTLGEGPKGRQFDVIVNPASALGLHARYLARHLPHTNVRARDLSLRLDSIWHALRLLREPANYSFEAQDLFRAPAERAPVVVFFGACGSTTDGIFDFGINSSSRLIAGRACCHHNVGNNTTIRPRSKRSALWFRFRNRRLARAAAAGRCGSFSDLHSASAFPRSQWGRERLDSERFRELACHAVDNEICRTLIDLDRCLYLQERGFRVLYRDEMFVAIRPPARPSQASESTASPPEGA